MLIFSDFLAGVYFEGTNLNHLKWRDLTVLDGNRFLKGGSKSQLKVGAHNSTYSGEITPITYLFLAIYRGYNSISIW